MTELEFFESFISERRRALIDDALKERTQHLTVVLDDVFQSRNIGAVVRSCDCFGVQNVHVLEGRNEYELREEVARGAEKWMSVHRYKKSEGVAKSINEIKAQGYKLYATVPDREAVSVNELPVNDKVALVFGNEKAGVSQEVIDLCDGLVTIPMYGFTESFNISVSASVFMHHLTNKYREEGVDFRLTDQEREELRLIWYKANTKDSELLENRYRLDHG